MSRKAAVMGMCAVKNICVHVRVYHVCAHSAWAQGSLLESGPLALNRTVSRAEAGGFWLKAQK